MLSSLGSLNQQLKSISPGCQAAKYPLTPPPLPNQGCAVPDIAPLCNYLVYFFYVYILLSSFHFIAVSFLSVRATEM